jgi:hypothetical protein
LFAFTVQVQELLFYFTKHNGQQGKKEEDCLRYKYKWYFIAIIVGKSPEIRGKITYLTKRKN